MVKTIFIFVSYVIDTTVLEFVHFIEKYYQKTSNKNSKVLLFIIKQSLFKLKFTYHMYKSIMTY